MGNKRLWIYKVTFSALMAESEDNESELQNAAGF
jgi:hypothetical protein